MLLSHTAQREGRTAEPFNWSKSHGAVAWNLCGAYFCYHGDDGGTAAGNRVLPNQQLWGCEPFVGGWRETVLFRTILRNLGLPGGAP